MAMLMTELWTDTRHNLTTAAWSHMAAHHRLAGPGSILANISDLKKTIVTKDSRDLKEGNLGESNRRILHFSIIDF